MTYNLFQETTFAGGTNGFQNNNINCEYFLIQDISLGVSANKCREESETGMYKQAFNWQSLMPGHPLFGFCHRYFLLLLFLKLASKLHFYSRQQKH